MIVQEELPMVVIPSMNDTHLEDMIIINRLDDAAKSENIDAVAQTLQELLDHTSIHFSDEEKLMKEAKFLDFNSHKSEHDRHLRELKSIIKYFQTHQDSKAIRAYIEGNLKSWMIHHVETMDASAAKFIQKELSL